MNGRRSNLHEVRILGLPLDLWSRAQEHVDGLVREFNLIAGDANPHRDDEPRQLLRLIDQLKRDYEEITCVQQVRLLNAAQAGIDTIDLAYTVPASIAGASIRLSAALDAADRYCQDGQRLLSLATPPDVLAFRRWFLSQFVDQLAGKEATSWAEWL